MAGKVGRPRKPRHLKILEGNRARRDILEDAIKPAKGTPAPPKHYDESRQWTWLVLTEELNACGALTLLDGPGVELLVDAIHDYRHAGAMLTEEGWIDQTERGRKPSPWHTIRTDAANRLLRLMREYGLSPSARSSFIGGALPPEKDPKATEYFGATG